MLPRSFNTPLIVLTLLTLLTAFSRQQGSAERLAALSTIGVLPTSSFVTAIRQTTGIQTTEALASSLPRLASAPPDLSSSRQALSPSLRSVFNDNKGKAKEVAEKSPATQEVALLPKRGYRARKPGIWAQCDSYYSVRSPYLFLLFFFLFFLLFFQFLVIYIYIYKHQRVREKKGKRKEWTKANVTTKKTLSVLLNRLPCGQLGSTRSRSGTYRMTR